MSDQDVHSRSWRDVTWVAFDTETTGRYPVESEICEIAAVKWTSAGEIGQYASLVKPARRMGEQVIAIHGITNEMVEDAPNICQVLPEFSKFIEGSVLLAHHAQFDLGFVASMLEQCGQPLPPELTICTSLLAQGNVPETPNHKLQTLVPFFGVDPGQAHRALDDARSCLKVAVAIMERLEKAAGRPLTVGEIADKMLRRSKLDLGPLRFARFSLNELRANEHVANFIEAAKSNRMVEMVYRGGSRPGQPRTILPIGVIRQLDGDALVAAEVLGNVASLQQTKRYWLKDVMSIV